MATTAPYIVKMTAVVQPQATAGSDLTTIIGRVPVTGTVTAVTYATVTAITGAATNNRDVALKNKGQDGSGTTTIAQITYDNGVNTVAGDENTVTLSGTPANLNVTEGDILAWVSTHHSTGIADPGGLVTVTIARS